MWFIVLLNLLLCLNRCCILLKLTQIHASTHRDGGACQKPTTDTVKIQITLYNLFFKVTFWPTDCSVQGQMLKLFLVGVGFSFWVTWFASYNQSRPKLTQRSVSSPLSKQLMPKAFGSGFVLGHCCPFFSACSCGVVTGGTWPKYMKAKKKKPQSRRKQRAFTPFCPDLNLEGGSRKIYFRWWECKKCLKVERIAVFSVGSCRTDGWESVLAITWPCWCNLEMWDLTSSL